ncbi:hypothetical protein [Microbacterium flavum]|uniref:Fibronectin type III-like domain-containing protein n=1 Tax=Microbacterium flavum TaxID=415216 RepID=A0ABS5XTC8_9MICO|nr:hypothetical protein [Microbacterium flavum]MBT8797790.1 hypothetical protein [Microbacterium flavum]
MGDDGESRVDIQKYIAEPAERTLSLDPGEEFTYTITVACSGQLGFCLDARGQDAVPAPRTI